MSFSFQIRGKTAAEAIDAVDAEMANVVAVQPNHARDAEAVKATARTYVALLPEDDERDVVISCSGALEWVGNDAAAAYRGVSVHVHVRLFNRE